MAESGAGPQRTPDDEDPLAGLIAGYYQRTPGYDADAPRRTMQALARPGISPWWGLAAAALAGITFLAGLTVGRRQTPFSPVQAGGPGIAAATPHLEPVRFALHAPAAHQVALVGEFNDWDVSATQLIRNPADSTWEVAVLLPPGLHVYSFVIDQTTWTVDPLAPRSGDDFGTRNAVILVRKQS